MPKTNSWKFNSHQISLTIAHVPVPSVSGAFLPQISGVEYYSFRVLKSPVRLSTSCLQHKIMNPIAMKSVLKPTKTSLSCSGNRAAWFLPRIENLIIHEALPTSGRQALLEIGCELTFGTDTWSWKLARTWLTTVNSIRRRRRKFGDLKVSFQSENDAKQLKISPTTFI